MAHLEKAARRIIGVRISPATPLLFCEAPTLSPGPGAWVLVESAGKVFPAEVALPARLIETHRLEGDLPQVLRAATGAELVEARVGWAVEAAARQRFEGLSAAQGWAYSLKEVEANRDRLTLKFSAAQEPDGPALVSLLKGLAGVSHTRVELFWVSEAVSPVGPNLAEWVNSLLKPPDLAVIAGAKVGEPLLDESKVYRPGQRVAPGPLSEAEQPVAVYDPATGRFWLNGVELTL